MDNANSNRRSSPRVAYPCLVKFFSESQGQEVYLTHTENISSGGCYLIVPKNATKGSKLSLELDLLDDGDHMVFDGMVAWIEQRSMLKSHKTFYYDIGISFDEMKEKDKKRLEDALGLLIKKGYKPTRLVH